MIRYSVPSVTSGRHSPQLPPAAAQGAEGWTERRVDLLKKLWADGLSASQIAKQLGGVSRNSVIGKVHRLGLSGRAEASRPTRLAKPVAAKPARPRPAAAIVIPFARVPLPDPAQADTLTPLPEEERCAHWCRWPIGDPKSAAFDFCGREQGWLTEARRDTYCPGHRAAERARSATHVRKKPASEKELLRSLRRYL